MLQFRREMSSGLTHVAELEGRLALQQEYIELLEEQAVQGTRNSSLDCTWPGASLSRSGGPLQRTCGSRGEDGSQESARVSAAAAAGTGWNQGANGRGNCAMGSNAAPVAGINTPSNIKKPAWGLGLGALAIAARFGSTVQSSRAQNASIHA